MRFQKARGSLREILTHSHPDTPGRVMVSLRYRPEINASGASVPEAIGNLVIAFPLFFRVSVAPRKFIHTDLPK